MNTLAIALAFLGSILGLVYAAMGVVALKYLRSATETDRVVGWSLWWWTEASRYSEAGQNLCRRGAWMFGAAALFWVFAINFWRR